MEVEGEYLEKLKYKIFLGGQSVMHKTPCLILLLSALDMPYNAQAQNKELRQNLHHTETSQGITILQQETCLSEDCLVCVPINYMPNRKTYA